MTRLEAEICIQPRTLVFQPFKKKAQAALYLIALNHKAKPGDWVMRTGFGVKGAR